MKPRAKTSLFVLLLLFATAYGQAQERLRIGTNQWTGYAMLHLAAERHDWAERTGTRLIDYPSTTEVMRAFRNGLLEGAALTLDELLTLAESDLSLKAVLVIDVSSGGDAIVARSEITSVEQLRGRIVGVESGAMGALLLSRALDLQGIQLDEVEIRHLEAGNHMEAFQRNEIDALVTFDPVRSRLLESGAVEIFDSRQIPGEIVDVLVFREDALTAHRDTIRTMIEDWFETRDFAERDPDAAARAMAPRTHLEPADLVQSLARMQFPTRERTRTMLAVELAETLQQLHAAMVEHRLVERRPLPDGLLTAELIGG